MAKALLLLSGGLDSTLAGRILLKMGIEVEAVNFTSPFCRCTPKTFGCSAARQAADRMGIPVRVLVKGEDYLDLVKHPKHGRGSGINPCIDCRIFTFRKAAELMKEMGADFVATGEVLGQRPMSQQRRSLELIERQSGLEGLIVRPLSAQLLEPSLPEQNGLIDRSQLLAIQGRSRQEQFSLAKEYEVFDYPCPAGGCLLTDAEFAARMRELFEREPACTLADARLLSTGRHFRLPDGMRAVVGRDEKENEILESVARAGDWLLQPEETTGPTVLLRHPVTTTGATDNDNALPAPSPESLRLGAELLARYAQANGTVTDVHLRACGQEPARPFANEAFADHAIEIQPDGSMIVRSVQPAQPQAIEPFRIGKRAAAAQPA